MDEFGEAYPLHLGVTEAGDGEDGRIKSAVGIGALMEDGIGDTIRVSLTEDPEFEIPVCKDLVKRYPNATLISNDESKEEVKLSYDPFQYQRRETFAVDNMGGKHVPVVISDLSKIEKIDPQHLQSIGYTYDAVTDKWNITDAAADYLYTGDKILDFALPGTLKMIVDHQTWEAATDKEKYNPIYDAKDFISRWNKNLKKTGRINFIRLDTDPDGGSQLMDLMMHLSKPDFPAEKIVLCFYSTATNAMQTNRAAISKLLKKKILNPVIILTKSNWQTPDEHLIHFATESGGLLLEGMGDGIFLQFSNNAGLDNLKMQGRTYLPIRDSYEFMNNTAFSILQATRTRISKTEYISCPSCGRTLFDLQETTAKIRAVTHHLKGVKIAIMGCIVNGPGEMADADFGYVGSGPGKITLYKGKDVIKRNVNSEIAVEELVNLLKDYDAWIEPI
jgi:(E)-4-hydroxy-3-methylbut-2-enyl-diphosphate synthase